MVWLVEIYPSQTQGPPLRERVPRAKWLVLVRMSIS